MTPRMRLLRIAAFPVCLVALFVFLLWPHACLTVRCENQLLLAWPIKTGDAFEVTFTHSLNQSPITDVIQWTGEDLLVVKSIFKAFGAGVPVPSDGVGSELHFVDGQYELTGINKHMQDFSILLSEVPDHSLTFKDHYVRLLEIVNAGRIATITVERISFFTLLFL
jgi:hypothetical protein